MSYEVKIYGRVKGCRFCDTAKQICEMNAYNMEFIDVEAEGIDGPKLQEICGEPVRTVPQIFIDGKYIGGCDKFIEFLKGE